MQDSMPLNVRVMVDACRKAEKVIMREFWSHGAIKYYLKDDNESVVTDADLHVEDIIKAELTKAKPGCGFICEEGGVSAADGSDFVYIIDPIDGTSNFIRKLPHFSISLALMRTYASGASEIVAGVVYAPVLREIYWAHKGRGAFLENGSGNIYRMRVSARKTLAKSVIAFVPNCLARPAGLGAVMEYYRSKQVKVRVFGSASITMAYVAAGKIEAFFSGCLKVWDVAAGSVLVREAGGLTTDRLNNRDFIDKEEIICSNAHVHDECLSILTF